MIGQMMATLNGWVASFDVLSEPWRVGIVVLALVLGTAAAAYIAGHIISALERKFAKTDNVWDDAALPVRLWWPFFGCRVCTGLRRWHTIIRRQRYLKPMAPCCRLASLLLLSGP